MTSIPIVQDAHGFASLLAVPALAETGLQVPSPSSAPSTVISQSGTTLPTNRITLAQQENLAIRAGLNIVLNGTAEIIVNRRRPPELLFSGVSAKYQPRSFSQEFYGTILNLRNELAECANQKSSKPYLNCFEFAAAALGVRITSFAPSYGFEGSL